MRIASEDIGLADLHASSICIEPGSHMRGLGSPEGDLSLARAVCYLALAPKSNAVYTAFSVARHLAKETGSIPPPKHILNAPTQLMKNNGYGDGYIYDHDSENAFSGQNFFLTSYQDRSSIVQLREDLSVNLKKARLFRKTQIET